RLSDAVDAMPMGEEQKLIEIRDLSFVQISSKALETLASILGRAKDMSDTVTVLVLRENEFICDYKTESSPTYKKLSSVAKVVRFNTYPPEKLASWEKKHFASKGITISYGAATALAEICACRMFTINSEFFKLEAYASSMRKNTITEEDVRLICAVSERDEAPFALTNAAEKWNIKEVLAAVYELRDLKKEPISILSRLSGIYSDMLLAKTARDAGKSAAELAKALRTRETRAVRLMSCVANVPLSKIEECIDEVYRADVKLKSTATDSFVVLEALIAKIYTPRSLLC
ncbi:MAG: DNA polymerase III subunit delta, partial [Eubacteriales bacterium]